MFNKLLKAKQMLTKGCSNRSWVKGVWELPVLSLQLFFKSKTIYNKNNWGIMSTNEREQRQTENMSPGMSGTPGMHGTLKRNNVHENDLTHQEWGGGGTGTLMTKSVHRPNKQFSPLKKYVYIYFAFLEIRIEVHFTLVKINAEGR